MYIGGVKWMLVRTGSYHSYEFRIFARRYSYKQVKKLINHILKIRIWKRK